MGCAASSSHQIANCRARSKCRTCSQMHPTCLHRERTQNSAVDGYGQCSHFRLINEHGQAHCSFIIGKAHVTPLKHKTIPRLELAAATTSARVGDFVRKELEYPKIQEFFWTDSRVVLGDINKAKKVSCLRC